MAVRQQRRRAGHLDIRSSFSCPCFPCHPLPTSTRVVFRMFIIAILHSLDQNRHIKRSVQRLPGPRTSTRSPLLRAFHSR